MPSRIDEEEIPKRPPNSMAVTKIPANTPNRIRFRRGDSPLQTAVDYLRDLRSTIDLCYQRLVTFL
jgi:hypothetical protein